MGYKVEDRKDTVVQAALQATEKIPISPKKIDQSARDISSTKASAEIISDASAKVYFQIED
jgi:hypothetical protein